MFDLEQEFLRLLDKHGINLKEEAGEEYNSANLLKRDIIKRWESLASDTRIAIWGAGGHTEELLKIIDISKKNVICIVDSSPLRQGEMLKGLPIYLPEAIASEKIDLIVVSSFSFRDEIIERIKSDFKTCNYFDPYKLYDDLDPEDIILIRTPFHRLIYMQDLLILMYKNSDPQAKGKILYQLIIEYLRCRDFIHAELFVHEYIRQGYPRSASLKLFMTNLKSLLSRVKEIVRARKTIDVNLVILDGLRASDVGKMPFLNYLQQKSISFTNAFSTSNYTRGTLCSAMYGSLPFESEVHKNRKYEFDINRSIFFKTFYDQGYQLFIKSTLSFNAEDTVNIKIQKQQSGSKETIMSTTIWEYLCEVLKQPERNFLSVLHVLETHPPYRCIYTEVEAEQSKTENQEFANRLHRYHGILTYVDIYLKELMDFVSSNSVNIFMADHGNVFGSPYGSVLNWYDTNIHVPLIVYCSKYNPFRYEVLFSLKDLPEQLLFIIQNGKPLEKYVEYIEMERDPIYRPSFDKLKTTKEAKFLNAYKVIRSVYDKYVIYADGLEEYYILPDEELNEINEPEYQERIKEIKSYINNFVFPNFEKGRNGII